MYVYYLEIMILLLVKGLTLPKLEYLWFSNQERNPKGQLKLVQFIAHSLADCMILG